MTTDLQTLIRTVDPNSALIWWMNNHPNALCRENLKIYGNAIGRASSSNQMEERKR